MLKRLTVSAFPALPSLRAALAAGRWRELPPKAQLLGWPAALRLWYARWCESGRPKPRLAKVRLAGFAHPLFFRPAGSDPAVIEQVFVQREYAAVAGLSGVEYIVDCGANIGCTTFFLLKHYPRARAVVVEPDAGNMAVCRRNLAPFGDRVTFVRAGVWSSAGPLVVERGEYRDGAEWSFRVRPARPDETADIDAVTIPDVLAAAGFPRADLLKIDIEGSEVEVFGSGSEGWLSRTRNIAIETHGPECERAVESALAAFRFDRGESGELAIYRSIVTESSARTREVVGPKSGGGCAPSPLEGEGGRRPGEG